MIEFSTKQSIEEALQARKKHKELFGVPPIAFVIFGGVLSGGGVFLFLSGDHIAGVVAITTFAVLMAILIISSHMVKKAVLEPIEPGKRIDWKIDDATISIESENSQSQFKWEILKKAVIVEGFILLYLQQEAYIFIPLKQLDDSKAECLKGIFTKAVSDHSVPNK